MARPEKPAIQPLASNRKALHDYEVLERLEGGLQLAGTEVKSARQGRVPMPRSRRRLRMGS